MPDLTQNQMKEVLRFFGENHGSLRDRYNDILDHEAGTRRVRLDSAEFDAALANGQVQTQIDTMIQTEIQRALNGQESEVIENLLGSRSFGALREDGVTNFSHDGLNAMAHVLTQMGYEGLELEAGATPQDIATRNADLLRIAQSVDGVDNPQQAVQQLQTQASEFERSSAPESVNIEAMQRQLWMLGEIDEGGWFEGSHDLDGRQGELQEQYNEYQDDLGRPEVNGELNFNQALNSGTVGRQISTDFANSERAMGELHKYADLVVNNPATLPTGQTHDSNESRAFFDAGMLALGITVTDENRADLAAGLDEAVDNRPEGTTVSAAISSFVAEQTAPEDAEAETEEAPEAEEETVEREDINLTAETANIEPNRDMTVTEIMALGTALGHGDSLNYGNRNVDGIAGSRYNDQFLPAIREAYDIPEDATPEEIRDILRTQVADPENWETVQENVGPLMEEDRDLTRDEAYTVQIVGNTFINELDIDVPNAEGYDASKDLSNEGDNGIGSIQVDGYYGPESQHYMSIVMRDANPDNRAAPQADGETAEVDEAAIDTLSGRFQTVAADDDGFTDADRDMIIEEALEDGVELDAEDFVSASNAAELLEQFTSSADPAYQTIGQRMQEALDARGDVDPEGITFGGTPVTVAFIEGSNPVLAGQMPEDIAAAFTPAPAAPAPTDPAPTDRVTPAVTATV